MWNLFKKPVEKTTFEIWGKSRNDIAKLAVVAIPAMLYSDKASHIIIGSVFALCIITYTFLSIGRFFIRLFEEK